MKFLFIICVLVLLSGCNQSNVKDVLSNLDKDCTRHYAGSAATGTPIGAEVIVSISSDGGLTWNAPVTVANACENQARHLLPQQLHSFP